jgi:hypothetical protein
MDGAAAGICCVRFGGMASAGIGYVVDGGVLPVAAGLLVGNALASFFRS